MHRTTQVVTRSTPAFRYDVTSEVGHGVNSSYTVASQAIEPSYSLPSYRKLVKELSVANKGMISGTKFDRLFSYGLANLHYLVVESELLGTHEVPTGWGLLVRIGESLQLAAKPVWQEISVEDQLVLLQRIASIKAAI